jgi:hypothetical protein
MLPNSTSIDVRITAISFQFRLVHPLKLRTRREPILKRPSPPWCKLDAVAHYADAFTILPGRCFRMVTDPEPRRLGHPDHCDEPVVWRGRFRTRGERVYRVDACEGHGGELTHRTRGPNGP